MAGHPDRAPVPPPPHLLYPPHLSAPLAWGKVKSVSFSCAELSGECSLRPARSPPTAREAWPALQVLLSAPRPAPPTGPVPWASASLFRGDSPHVHVRSFTYFQVTPQACGRRFSRKTRGNRDTGPPSSRARQPGARLSVAASRRAPALLELNSVLRGSAFSRKCELRLLRDWPQTLLRETLKSQRRSWVLSAPQ